MNYCAYTPNSANTLEVIKTCVNIKTTAIDYYGCRYQ